MIFLRRWHWGEKQSDRFFSSGMIVEEHYTARLWTFTYTNYVHEAIHAVAYLEEQVLPLPFCWGTERRPHQPGYTGDKKQRSQDDGCNLHSLNYSERDGLPLQGRQMRQNWIKCTEILDYLTWWKKEGFVLASLFFCFCFSLIESPFLFLVQQTIFRGNEQLKSAPFKENYEY